jgi:hypothetical protein
MLELPGKARRATVNDEIVIPKDALPLAGPHGPPTGLDPKELKGLIVDDRDAQKQGTWTEGQGLKGYVGYGYHYSTNGSIKYELKAPKPGKFELRLAYQPHENRGDKVPVLVETQAGRKPIEINMQKAPPLENGFVSLGEYTLSEEEPVIVVLSTQGAGGHVHADAVQLIEVIK